MAITSPSRKAQEEAGRKWQVLFARSQGTLRRYRAGMVTYDESFQDDNRTFEQYREWLQIANLMWWEHHAAF